MKQLFSQFAQVISETDIDGVPKVDASSSRITDGLQIVFAISAAVAVLIIAVSAFRMVISRGNAQDVQKSRDAIVYAVVGLIVALAAFSIVTFVVERV